MMTAAQSAALERIIAAARAHPLALTVPESSKTTVEAGVRRIAGGGMTLKEAHSIVAALDTPDERAQVHALIASVATERDAQIVLSWLLADVQRVLSAPEPAPETGHAGGAVTPHATTFLRRNATISSHVLLSDKLTDAKRQEIIDYNKAQGYSVLYVYCANEGDYDKQGVAYDHGKQAMWRRWLQAVIDSGARVIMWGCADDSSGLSRRTFDQWRVYWGLVHADCGDLVSEWVTGLECDERWSAGTTQTLTRLLKEITGKPVGVHTTSIGKIGHAAGADAFYIQTGFGRTPAQVAAVVREAKAKFSGRVICAEYSKSGDTDAAKAIGDAAIDAGADGVGNGCTAAGLAMLGKGTPVVTAGLTFRYLGGGMRDVAWSPAVDRSSWPTKTVDGSVCDGLLYGARVGEDPRKIEWIKRNKQEAHTKNAWEFAKDRKYNQRLTGGERMLLQIRDINGKVRGAELAGECGLG